MECWSDGVLPLLLRFSLINGFDFVLAANLASIPHSGRNSKLWQNVSLERHPQDNKQNNP
jgi:hypothetical protein